jgi:hypothetical protein
MNKEGNGAIGLNLTIFFGRFLTTPEEMNAHLGFKGSQWRAPGLLEA